MAVDIALFGVDPTDDNGNQPRRAPGAFAPAAAGKWRAYVIGAGITGLTTAWQLAAGGMDVVVLEANRYLGGMAATIRHGEFELDLGPHKFFSVMTDRMQLFEEVMAGEEMLTVPKTSRIVMEGRFLNYPISLVDVMKNLNPSIILTGGFSYLGQLVRSVYDRRPDASYEAWLVRRFGRVFYDLIFGAYAKKIWGDPTTLARELAETRVAIPGLLPLLWHLLVTRNKGRVIHAETFRYPAHGSGEFCRALADKMLECGGTLRFGAPVTQVSVLEGRINGLTLASGETIPVRPEDLVVSTCPIQLLTRALAPAAPEPAARAAAALESRHLILLYLHLNRPRAFTDSWIFFPETKYLFTRLSEQKNFSTATCPKETTCLCLEVVATDESVWNAGDRELFERGIAGLEAVGLADRGQVTEYFTKRIKWAYPIYKIGYQQNAATLYAHLDGIENLYSVGRLGGFNYVGQIDCLDIGMTTAEFILAGRPKSAWGEARARFANYIVLD